MPNGLPRGDVSHNRAASSSNFVFLEMFILRFSFSCYLEVKLQLNTHRADSAIRQKLLKATISFRKKFALMSKYLPAGSKAQAKVQRSGCQRAKIFHYKKCCLYSMMMCTSAKKQLMLLCDLLEEDFLSWLPSLVSCGTGAFVLLSGPIPTCGRADGSESAE